MFVIIVKVQRQIRKAFTVMKLLDSVVGMGELAYALNRINQLIQVYIKTP